MTEETTEKEEPTTTGTIPFGRAGPLQGSAPGFLLLTLFFTCAIVFTVRKLKSVRKK